MQQSLVSIKAKKMEKKSLDRGKTQKYIFEKHIRSLAKSPESFMCYSYAQHLRFMLPLLTQFFIASFKKYL